MRTLRERIENLTFLCQKKTEYNWSRVREHWNQPRAQAYSRGRADAYDDVANTLLSILNSDNSDNGHESRNEGKNGGGDYAERGS